MSSTHCTVTYTDGSADREFDSIQQAVVAIKADNPDCAIYDAGGWDHDECDTDDVYDVRSGRAALVWASEEESVNDDGAKAIAQICVEATER